MPKNVVLLIAALVWGFAAFKLLTIGVGEILSNQGFRWLYLAGSAVVGYFFFTKIIFKVYQKHTRRIIAYQSGRLCVFAFFDTRSYLIMAFMMAMGISLRRFGLMPPLYIGLTYLAIGVPLFLAALLFVNAGLNLGRELAGDRGGGTGGGKLPGNSYRVRLLK